MGFDAGAITAHMKLEVDEFNAAMDRVEERVDKFESETHVAPLDADTKKVDEKIDHVEQRLDGLEAEETVVPVRADTAKAEEKLEQVEALKEEVGGEVEVVVKADTAEADAALATTAVAKDAASGEADINVHVSGAPEAIAEMEALKALTGNPLRAYSLLSNGVSQSDVLNTLINTFQVSGPGAARAMTEALERMRTESERLAGSLGQVAEIVQWIHPLPDYGPPGIISGGNERFGFPLAFGSGAGSESPYLPVLWQEPQSLLDRAGNLEHAAAAMNFVRSELSIIEGYDHPMFAAEDAARTSFIPDLTRRGGFTPNIPLDWLENGPPGGWENLPRGAVTAADLPAEEAIARSEGLLGGRGASGSILNWLIGAGKSVSADGVESNDTGAWQKVASVLGNNAGFLSGIPLVGGPLSSAPIGAVPLVAGLIAQLGGAVAGSLAGVLSGFIIGVPGLLAGAGSAYEAFKKIEASKPGTGSALGLAKIGFNDFSSSLHSTFAGVEQPLIPVLGNLARSGAAALPGIKPFVAQSGKGFGDFLNGVGSALTSPDFQAWLKPFAADVRPIMDEFGTTLINLLQAIGEFGTDFFPLADSVGKWFERWTLRLDLFLGHFRMGKSDVGEMTRVWNILGEVWTDILWPAAQKIGGALLTIGGGVLAVIGWLAPFAKVLINAFPEPLLVAIGIVVAGMWALSGALAIIDVVASPVTLIALAIAGVIFAGYELVTHWHQVWTDVKNWMHDAWVFINKHFLLIALALGPVGPIFLGIYFLAKHWSTVWDDVKRVALDAWHFLDRFVIQPIGAGWAELCSILQKFDLGSNPFDALWNAFKATADGIVRVYNDTIGKIPGFGNVTLPWQQGPASPTGTLDGANSKISKSQFNAIGLGKSGDVVNIGTKADPTIIVNFHGDFYSDDRTGLEAAAKAGVLKGVTAAFARSSQKATPHR